MDEAFNERRNRFIASIQAAYLPEEKSYWQHPPPSYFTTGEYAANQAKPMLANEPVLFKKNRKEGMIVLVMIVVAAILIYLVATKDFQFTYLIILVLLLIIILPILLNNKTLIRLSPEGMWVFPLKADIPWPQVVLTYIKVQQEELPQYSLIVHYYDSLKAEFQTTEILLEPGISPRLLAATIEAYRTGAQA